MTKEQKTHVSVLMGTVIVLAGLYVVSRQDRAGFVPASNSSLVGVTLPSVGQPAKQISMKSCPTEKCLTVYLSPWCGVCRASTDFVKALSPWMAKRGIATRIVIGRDRPDAVADYAKTFGPDTFIDADGRFPLKGGVPQFIISDQDGNILKAQPGVLRIVRPPIPEAELEALARALGFKS